MQQGMGVGGRVWGGQVGVALVWALLAAGGGMYGAEPLSVATLAGAPGERGHVDGAGAAARFEYPTGVAAAADGAVYVADPGAGVIRRIAANGQVSTVAGTPGQSGSADGTGSAARFNGPWSLAVGPDGTVAIADTFGHTIRRMTPAGVVTTLAGLAGQTGGADGTGSAARFNQPFGIAVDAAGVTWVADTGNHTIRRISPAGEVTTVAGLPGAQGLIDGTGNVARFRDPFGIGVAADGALYISDRYNHAIRRMSPGGAVTTVAGNGSFGITDGVGAAARFASPVGMVVRPSGQMFVSEEGSHRIRLVTLAGGVTAVAGEAFNSGFANGTGTAARFSMPQGLAVSPVFGLVIADYLNAVVRFAALGSSAIITSPLAAEGVVGQPFSLAVTLSEPASGFAASGLPTGLAINTASGLISGTPAQAGTYSVGLSITGSSGVVTGTLVLTITAAPASITLGTLPDRYLADGTATVPVTTSPGNLALRITFNGSTTPPTVPGDYAVRVELDDPAYAAPAAEAVWRLRGRQSVRFDPPAQVSLGAGILVLGGHADSGLPVSYTLVAGAAMLDGAVLTLQQPGPVTVRANQPGNAIWDAAAPRERTIEVVNGVVNEPSAPAADGVDPLIRHGLVLADDGIHGDELPVTGLEDGYLTIAYVRRLNAPWLSWQVEAVSQPNDPPELATLLSGEEVTPLDADREWVFVRDVVPVASQPGRMLRVRIVNSGTVLQAQVSAARVAVGEPVLLRATVTGQPVTGYQWYRNGEFLSGANHSTLSLAAVQTWDAGVYTVAASGTGTALSNGVSLAVEEHPAGIFLLGGQVAAGTPAGVAVGRLAAAGRDGSPVTAFSLVAGAGGEDNGSFTVFGDELRTAVSFAGATREVWSVRVRAEDRQGNVQEEALAVQLYNPSEIKGVFGTVGRSYGIDPVPFPIVPSSIHLNFDLETADVVWWAQPNALYAVEASTNGGPWNRLQGGHRIETGFGGQYSFGDDATDFGIARTRLYRVRRLDVPPAQSVPVERPSLAKIAGVPQIGFLFPDHTIAGPAGVRAGTANNTFPESILEYQQVLVDPTGQAAWYEIHVPTLIGTQMRITSPELNLPLSRNFTQGQAVDLGIFAYNWQGELVAAWTGPPLRAHFSEVSIRRLTNLETSNGFSLPDLAYIYGTNHQGTLTTRYGRVDSRSGSTQLDLILHRSDGGMPNQGSFRIFLPDGLVEGQPRWSSVDQLNAGGRVCLMQAPAVDHSFPFFVGGAWEWPVGGFRWDTNNGRGILPFDPTSFGYFDIRKVREDGVWEVWEIELVANAGFDSIGFGKMTVIIPRRW